MTVYIAGKITEDPNYRAKFKKAENQLLQKSHHVINPAEICANLPSTFKREDYLSITLQLIDHADCVALLNDWRESPGACIEIGFAYASDKIILGIDDLIEE